MQKKILIATALLASISILQACGNATDTTTKTEMESSMNHKMDDGASKMENPMMESINGTMIKMKEMKMTGDFDLDFATMMLMHHQGAIEMSEVEIAKGTDEKIKSMAKNIIASQKAEIDQLEAFIKSYKLPDPKMKDNKMHNELAESMKAGMDKMHGMVMNGNTDKDFVMMMIPHHESAVNMAKDELSHGKQETLKKMAQKMIADQTKEIDEFKAWIAKQ